ncbi:MAG: c-type cytochrome [Gemmatimonadales bacterium]
MRRIRLFASAACLVLAAACRRSDQTPLVPGASISAGKAAIREYSCGACHQIPGIPEARGLLGPPLTGIRERTLIAGEVANSAANLAAWIHDPQAIEPTTGMPDLGVDDSTARDIVAYLYTVH